MLKGGQYMQYQAITSDGKTFNDVFPKEMLKAVESHIESSGLLPKQKTKTFTG